MRLIDGDELLEGYKVMGYDPTEHPEESYMEGWCNGFNAAVDHCMHHVIHAQTVMVVNAAPTVEQPEIIRCRDCKYWMPYDWMFSEVWKSKNMEDYPENEIGCAYADMSMSATDFCSRAERREVSE